MRRNIENDLDTNYREMPSKNNIKEPITADENKVEYLKNYAIYLKMPTIEIKDTKFYHKDPEYFIQLC